MVTAEKGQEFSQNTKNFIIISGFLCDTQSQIVEIVYNLFLDLTLLVNKCLLYYN